MMPLERMRIVGRIRRVAFNSLKAFFDIGIKDNLVTGAGKVAATALRRAAFVFIDYWAAIILAAIVSLMKYHGYTYLEIFIAAWAYDFMVATGFYLIQMKSGQDITLGEALRRAADVIQNEHRLAGYVTFFLITIKAIVWEGPEQIVIFYKIGGAIPIVAALISLSFVQGLFGAWLYSTGYDGITAVL